MKAFCLFIISVLAISAFTFLENKKNISPPASGTVVLELFTSQGCSSCPSADKLMAQTIASSKTEGNKIIGLSFHVDYWNRLGWKDPYSKKEWTQRQYQYGEWFKNDGVYTPQLVVNGVEEFVGSDKNKLGQAMKGTGADKIKFSVSQINWNGKNISAKVASEGSLDDIKLFAVIIAKHTQNYIPRGENSGITLSGNNVVMEMTVLKSEKLQALSMPIPSGLIKDNAALVIFAQHNLSHKILSGQEIDL